MSRPAFIYGGPPEVNFGALGFIITHKLMHGFDVTGRLFDGLGELNDWFTDMSRNAYEEREICHARSIENSPKARHFVDYPGEYLADTMGTDSLLKAYKKASLNSTVTLCDVKGLTSDQLFYVSRCLVWCGKIFPDTTHPPLDERCNVPLMNSDHFSDTFRCPTGAPMNSPIKCRFW
ncbi:neprilysin-1-like [Ornithodoros turicata]|uniref:neprilysin-1-like n=1 Tax=Ornithodoros turicata TaxID=34597 RepID=UPI003138EDF8